MKHLHIFEDFPAVYAEPIYANDIFKVRFRQNTDLSNKRANDTNPVPIDDLLDQFQIGDFVEGVDKHDVKHCGKIARIVRDEKGNGAEIMIDEDGETINLVVNSVKFAEQGEVGQMDPKYTGADRNIQDMDPTSGAEFYGSSYESKSFRNVKKFSDI